MQIIVLKKKKIQHFIIFAGFAIPVLRCDLTMTAVQKGMLASACFAGIICGYELESHFGVSIKFLGIFNHVFNSISF